jgi:hypothetical protein
LKSSILSVFHAFIFSEDDSGRMMEAVCTSETSVYFNETIRRYILMIRARMFMTQKLQNMHANMLLKIGIYDQKNSKYDQTYENESQT